MKVPIKFRGRFWLKGLEPSDINTRLSDGDFVFGGYARMKFLFDDDEGDYIIQNDSTAFLVYPDSVAQLVGYDVDGKEIYEGDTLVDKDGNIWDKLEIYSDVDNAFTVQKYKLRLKN